MTGHQKTIRPIFIVGMNGSGTTMLADCLNHHKDIFIPMPESKVIPYFYENIERYGDLDNYRNFSKLLHDFSNSHIFRRLDKGTSVVIPYNFEQLANRNLATVIELTFLHFASREGKNIWGDHSPKYAYFLPILTELFPGAKIIHITRDGRDCALSFRRRFKQNIYRSMHQWKKLVTKARSDGRALGQERYFEIRYEDLTAMPEYWMRLLMSFLELPFSNGVLSSKMPMYGVRGDMDKIPGRIVPNSGKWQTAFSPEEITKMELIAGKTLYEFGYKVHSHCGDRDLGTSQLCYLNCRDKMSSLYVYIRDHKGSNLTGDVAKMVATSLKQMRYFRH